MERLRSLAGSMGCCAVALGMVFGAVAPAAGQIDFSKVEITTERLADSVYMLRGSGGNLGLSIGNDAVFLIDDQFAPLTPKIQAAISALTSKPVKFVLNTHWHGDHTGGNERFAEAGALIVAHDNVRRRMSADQVLDFFKLRVEPSPRAALALATDRTKIIPGHGPLAAKADLRAYREMLATVQGRIKANSTNSGVTGPSSPTAS